MSIRPQGCATACTCAAKTRSRQTIAVGETYDFEVQSPAGRKTLWVEVRTVAGQWQLQSQVIVK